MKETVKKMISSKTTKLNDSIINNRERSARYAQRNKLKNKVRRLARKYPLKDKCEFCESTEQLERAHFIYDLKHPELFLTTCKKCHEQLDIIKIAKYKVHQLSNYLNENEIDKVIENPYEAVKLEIEKTMGNESEEMKSWAKVLGLSNPKLN